ncbi:MAG: hypothetical protein HUJ56_09260, partial [Erysipelotrichaceae bacterium]|nr:hypothetical protein [Erysipelotrichaceae bacterium]
MEITSGQEEKHKILKIIFMKKKFELVQDQSIVWRGRTLYRIRALRTIGVVKKGDLGGYVEKEDNLSHEGLSWIYKDAKVYEDALVCDSAEVFDNAEVFGEATINEFSRVYHSAKVYDKVRMLDHSFVYDNAVVSGEVFLGKLAHVGENAKVSGNVKLHETASVEGNATVCGNVDLYSVKVSDSAEIYGSKSYTIRGLIQIQGDTRIGGKDDFIMFDLPWCWRHDRFFRI